MKRIAAALLMFSAALTAVAQTPREDRKIDVPPIEAEYGPLVRTWCDQGCWDVPYDPKDQKDAFGPKPHRNKRLTCADKTRFLMTAEDGSKHCIALRNPTKALR